MKISEVLREVAEHEEPGVNWNWNLGLCTNIHELFGIDTSIKAKRWMQQHPDFSGHLDYHIKPSPDALHGRWGKGPADAYHTYDDDLYVGTYGKNRREMALYLSILFAKEDL